MSIQRNADLQFDRLNQDPEAELFVFVGRWSNQKGVDAIADVFPSILERYPKVQLICVGPVIDLYGKFAAIKLDRMMELYKGRVFSQPEFTALPPYIFSGADFALMPSRDEPFGLVAVEFGRKGVLCIGAYITRSKSLSPITQNCYRDFTTSFVNHRQYAEAYLGETSPTTFY